MQCVGQSVFVIAAASQFLERTMNELQVSSIVLLCMYVLLHYHHVFVAIREIPGTPVLLGIVD